MINCEHCDGTGLKPETKEKCGWCNGTGEHRCSYSSSSSNSGSAICRVFVCRVCGDEWEKDVS